MNEKTRSITLRLFSTVFLVIVLLNILSIIGVLGLTSLSRKNMTQEYSYAMQLYMNQLDRELGQAQTRMYDLSHTYEYNLSMTDPETGADPYEILRSQVSVYNTMGSWLLHYPLIDGYFVYQEEKSLLIIDGEDSAAVYTISQELGKSGLLSLSRKAQEETVLPEFNSKWTFQDREGQGWIIFATIYRNAVYGAWVQTERLFREWEIPPESADRYRILQSSSPQPADCVDVGSVQADCILRYQLPSAASTIPTGVKILLIASVIMLLALPIVWFSVQRLVIHPLRALIGAIHRIEAGDPEYRIPEKTTSNEFDQLNAQFNHSLDQLENMHLQVYESRMEKERIYINYLSQQMQPHFVLNTLNLIFSMEPEEYDLIQETVAHLADYYRYIAHITDPMVPVSAELSHVENYFKLQQIRYPGMFFYEITCPAQLRSAMIPPIIIQTFAENAIKHSLIVGEENRVEIMLEEWEMQNMHIRIRDHGKGYPPEILQKIEAFRETGVQQEGLGIGIQNTIERVRLIYQEQADVTFKNAPDNGAQIDLYLPVRFQENG